MTQLSFADVALCRSYMIAQLRYSGFPLFASSVILQLRYVAIRLLRLLQLGYGDHPSSCLSFSGSCTTYQLLSRWQISRRVPSPIFTRQLSHTRSSPITHDRDSCHPTSAKGKILPSYHLMPHGLYSPSGLHSTKAVTSLIDFSPTLTPKANLLTNACSIIA